MAKVLAMHQPNFAPWAGWFSKLIASDVFVIMDTAQVPVSRRCYAREVKVKGRWLRIELHQKGLPYNETVVVPRSKSIVSELLGSIYGGNSDYEHLWMLQFCLHNTHNILSDYNMYIIKAICNGFGVDWASKIVYQSTLGIDAPKELLPARLAVELNCSVYLSGMGARSYNRPEVFEQENIALRYIKPTCSPLSVMHNILQDGALGAGEVKILTHAEATTRS